MIPSSVSRTLQISLIQKLNLVSIEHYSLLTMITYGKVENEEHIYTYDTAKSIGKKIIESLQKGVHEINVDEIIVSANPSQ